jgi:hypothetical protein
MNFKAITAVVAAGGLLALASQGGAQPAQRLAIKVLSSPRPDLVSGGDTLVEVTGAGSAAVTLTVNGAASTALHPDPERRSLVGLVTGLKNGPNALQASAGAAKATLTVVNHPITGPILSGPHMKPYECRTKESGLGEPLDANCSATTKVEYFYKSTEAGAPGRAGAPAAANFKPWPAGARPTDLATTTTIDGKTVPYIVRVESGTVNRSIYRIAVLDDASAIGSANGGVWKTSQGWNRRLAVSFGGGAGTQYNQGVNQATAPLSDLFLSRGFAHMVATELVNQQHGNAVLQGETLMMLKEHFIERYGLPKWTVGNGGSGGAIQQLVITQIYPGLLDGLTPSVSFPDSTLHTADCGLLQNFFKTKTDASKWSDADHAAVEGLSKGTCASWESSFVPTMKATNARGCALNDASLIYDPVKNPKGARCTINDMRVNIYGRDPKTGFARKPYDNTGIQYGLLALNKGALTVDKFLEVNEKIGGTDVDGNYIDGRAQGDLIALRNVYGSGLINSGGGGLKNVPIIHFRAYSDNRSDIHSRERDLTIRARLQKANGRTDNQVIWVSGAQNGGPNLAPLVLDAMTKWLDNLAADPAPLSTDKVVRHKPPEAVDAYWDASGRKIAEVASWDNETAFNKVYPVHLEPRLAAGAPPANDVIKCTLKPVNSADYKVAFTPEQQARLKRIFPTGVCDYAKPGVGQVALRGVYQKY